MPTRLERPRNARLPADLIDRWRAVPAAVAADHLGGTAHADARIRPLRAFAAGTRLTGSAVTAWCEPADYGPMHHAIDVAGAGDVIVVAADQPEEIAEGVLQDLVVAGSPIAIESAAQVISILEAAA